MIINFLPPSQTPPKRTPTMIRKDKVLQARQDVYLAPMVSFYAGIAIITLLVALFTK